MYITGIDVILYDTTSTTTDEFGAPVTTETAVTIHNVLVVKPSTKEAVDTFEITGKRVQYTLCIPKGDNHNWENKKVEFFGKAYRTIGGETQYIEHLTPLDWNRQIMVECYE